VGRYSISKLFTVKNFKSNMKKLFFLPLLAILAMAATSTVNYKADLVSSNIIWHAAKVTGTHTGTVKLKNGNLQLTDGKLTGGSFEIDMNSIACTDLEGEWAGKLVGHIKSDDFFGVEKYPTSKFVITRAIPTDSKGNYKIIGNLTIKETTKEIKFPANLSEAAGQVTATGKITVDRSEYNVRYGSGSFFDGLGDKTIYDDFDLNVTLVTKK
jgi:polyisoprenoid-binding protein YceI